MKQKRMTRQESREFTRENLISSARTVFLKAGYGASKIEDITAAAGFTRGAFYSNFESKDEILLELLRRDERSMLDPMTRMLEENTSQDQLEAACLTYFKRLFMSNTAFPLWVEAQLLAGRDKKFRKAFNSFIQEEWQQITQFLEAMENTGVSLKMPADTLALALMSLFEGVQAYYCADPKQMTEEKAESILGDFFAVFVFGHDVKKRK